MVKFVFTVNSSFLDSRYNHPITIPKEWHATLSREGLDTDDVTVTFPNGTRMNGYIGASVAGWGDYHQIRVRGGFSAAAVGNLRIGQILNVEIRKSIGGVKVSLT